MSQLLRIGLIINPLAGLGGSLALKGSDGPELRAVAQSHGEAWRHRARDRVQRALAPLLQGQANFEIVSWAGEMGAELLQELGIDALVLGREAAGLSTAEDTRSAALAMREAGVHLILFAGGDGTARDIYDAIGGACPVLGIPAGVKMHSGVFAVSPEAAGELLLELTRGGLVGLQAREVRDIDEEAFRRDRVRSRFYGELLVPGEGRYLQHTKVGGRESEELVAADIGAWLAETMEPEVTYLVGPGSTTAAIMAELGLENTLLGVDVVRDGEVLASDADEEQLLACLAEMPGPAQILVTAIGGQGHIFGRCNQQFNRPTTWFTQQYNPYPSSMWYCCCNWSLV